MKAVAQLVWGWLWSWLPTNGRTGPLKRRHHLAGLTAWAISWSFATIGGSVFAMVEHTTEGLGLYWAVSTVETVGYGDITPHTTAGHWIAVGTMITGITVWSIAIAFFTSWLLSLHIKDSEVRIKVHVDQATAPTVADPPAPSVN